MTGEGMRAPRSSVGVAMLPSTTTLTRRDLLIGLSVTLASGCARRASSAPPSSPPAPEEPDAFAAIEASVGGRVGVFALDTGSGDRLARRADERFAMCSTFKWALAAAVLERVDRGALRLSDTLPYGEADLLEHAPTTRARLAEGALSIEALASAAVIHSDNTAANLLLAKLGGPPELTRFFRRLGDSETRLDRDEPTLNANEPGDPRDTTTPRAMVTSMRAALCGDALAPESRERLLGWLIACETGHARLRAGLPPHWTVGDKTGTGNAGAVHDVAVAIPPGRAPILIAAYMSGGDASPSAKNGAHAAIARAVVAR